MKTSAALNIPETEGIKFAGSKLKLLPHILLLAQKVKFESVFDAFAGTTRVSQAFAQSGYRVISNDCAVWSKVFAECYLKNKREENFYREIIEHLNHLPPKDGWFTEHYGGFPSVKNSAKKDGLKKPFQIHNTRKLDAIRNEIDRLDLAKTEKNVLLTSLILALDRVDSTIGHYAAYLNEWSPRSFKTLKLTLPRLFKSEKRHKVYCRDIFDIIEKVECDLAYFDPPYGSNNEKMPPSRVRYAAYYHLWTSVVLNDKPELFGKAKRRVDTSDAKAGSVFEDFRKSENRRFIAAEAIEKLLSRSRARYVILSYSSGGRATGEELFEILENSGKILDFIKVDYRQNVMASMRWTNDWTRAGDEPNQEYLFLIEKK
ncbi:DNA adenine methylase [soil metagenome]